MATFENWVSRVWRMLGSKKGNPPKLEIREAIIDAIREVQDYLPLDALKDLQTYHTYAMAGNAYIDAPDTNILHIVSLKAEESDGDMGYPWVLKTRKEFDIIKRAENDANFDASTTRIFAPRSPVDTGSPTGVQGWDLYPTPISGRDVRLYYILGASVTGTMTMPVRLHQPTIFMAAGHFNSDFANKAYLMLERIRSDSFNEYGLSPAKTGGVKMVEN